MAFSVVAAFGLIGIAVVGFVAIAALLYFAARTCNGRSRAGANEDSPDYIVAKPNEQNPYAPTSTPAAKRAGDFGRTAFVLFVVFGTLFMTILIIVFAMLSWRLSAVA